MCAPVQFLNLLARPVPVTPSTDASIVKLFVPASSGEVVPNNQIGSENVTIYNYFTVADDMDMEEVALELAEVYRTRMD